MLFGGTVTAKGGKDIRYVKTTESPYDYRQEQDGRSVRLMSLAADSETGEIIPFSAISGEYCYAYLPAEVGFEVKTVEIPTYTETALQYGFQIEELSARGVMKGFEDGSFRESRTLTRAEMAAVFARLFSVKPEGKPEFSDIPADSWYGGYVAALTELGIFQKDQFFQPDSPVAREQLTAMLWRMLGQMGYEQKAEEFDFSQYRDIDEVSNYAKEAYKGLLSNGYIVLKDVDEHEFENFADDEFFLNPSKPVTRGECADVLKCLIETVIERHAPAIRRDGAPEAEIPVLDGSTSTYSITRNIYWQYYENCQNHPGFPKAHSKTSNSYKRLIDGEVEMIFVPDPSEEIREYAAQKNVKLQYIPIANEALIFFTGNGSKADRITTEQLQRIYIENKIDSWKEISGEDAVLVPYCRNNDSGSHAQMEQFILNGRDIHADIQKERTSWIMSSILTDVNDFNRENPGKWAMGYSLYYYYIENKTILGPLDLKLLSVDGVAPSEETISSGAYPYTTHYYAVIREADQERLSPFITLMQGDFGDMIVANSGLGVIPHEQ